MKEKQEKTKFIIPAEESKLKLESLMTAGLTLTIIADKSGVSRVILDAIMRKENKNVEKPTHDKIMSLKPDMFHDEMLVSANSTFSLIDELVNQGFKKAYIFKRANKPNNYRAFNGLISVSDANLFKALFLDLNGTTPPQKMEDNAIIKMLKSGTLEISDMIVNGVKLATVRTHTQIG